MKLLRQGPKGQERPELLDRDGQMRDLSAGIPDLAGDALPVAFPKWTSHIASHDDDLNLPKKSTAADRKVDLGIDGLGPQIQHVRGTTA